MARLKQLKQRLHDLQSTRKQSQAGAGRAYDVPENSAAAYPG